jgi:pimeloyl-ACP methyl ester carboxylesterase
MNTDEHRGQTRQGMFGMFTRFRLPGPSWGRVAGLCLALGMLLLTTGCGSFIAHAMVRSPNRYSQSLAPTAPVTLAFDPQLLTRFPAHTVDVGTPSARLMYRVVEPADYRLDVSATNWMEHGRIRHRFQFKAAMPAPPHAGPAPPRGTVLLLHGYGLAQFSMLPWALRLGGAGYRCVLVDLRGHGKSTGPTIYFGLKETGDLRELMDALQRDGQLRAPVSVIGDSYGATLALRLKAADPRIQAAVAMAPYGCLSNAVMNVRQEYASWIPRALVRSGIQCLPSVLSVPADELDTTTVLRRQPVEALFVSGGLDRIATGQDVAQLRSLALPGSRTVVVPHASHEVLPFCFADLETPVLTWLARDSGTVAVSSPLKTADADP